MKNEIKYEYVDVSEGNNFPFTLWNKITAKDIKRPSVFTTFQ